MADGETRKKWKAKQQLMEGNRLVMERNRRKRAFDVVSATEQEALKDYDTGISAKRYAKECGKNLPFFRGESS